MPASATTLQPPIRPEWKEHPKSWGHPFHPMCSYMAMFPPRLPHYFIQRFTQPGDRVLDPFSGRGTTSTQACVEGRIGIASDLNPLAYILSQAKVDPPTLQAALARLAELQAGYSPGPAADVSPPDVASAEDINAVFHPRTLEQLRYLRDALGASREDIFITATILGILHGKYRRKGDDSIYLSVDMPNTFSMSPGYIRRFVREKHIRLLPLDVFTNARRRLQRLYRQGPPVMRGEAYQLDIRHLHTRLKPGSVNLVVSSPPYLKVVKYGLYNWIRLWFLGIAAAEVDRTLDDGHALPAYLKFMQEALGQIETLLVPGGVCVLVIGDVAQRGAETLNLARAVWDHVAGNCALQLIDIVADPIADNVKVTKIWNATRGRATGTDRILVLGKGSPITTNRPTVDWSQPGR